MEASEYKNFKFEMKEMNDSKGTFEGYAAVFNNVDEVEDVIEKGAFLRSINSRQGSFPLLFSHLYHEPSIGKAIFSEDSYGLLTKGALFIDRMDKAKNIYLNMKEGVCNSMSFMYDVVLYEIERKGDSNIRRLKELKIYEASLLNTGFGANSLAGVTAVKGKEFKEFEERMAAMEKTLLELKGQTKEKQFTEQIESQLKALRNSMELAVGKSTSKESELAEGIEAFSSLVQTIKKDLTR